MDRKTILTYRGPNIGGDGGMNMDPNNNRNIRDNAFPNLGTYRSWQVGNLLITTGEKYLEKTFCAPHTITCDRNSRIDESDGFEGRGDVGMNMDPYNNRSIRDTGGYGGGYNGGYNDGYGGGCNGGYDIGYGRGLHHDYGNDGGLGDGNGRGCSFDVARGFANTRDGVYGRMYDVEHHNGEARGYRDGYWDGYVDGHNRASGERNKGRNLNNGNDGINCTNGIKGIWAVNSNVHISLNNCNNVNNRHVVRVSAAFVACMFAATVTVVNVYVTFMK
ncbi:hypothetical protein BSL78_09154 [Apostichopus japonicus]|uniref:Uncharacterized protein n=1 Tax=Stichopus japonicus TaxID=307972 RepID=A0A2G8L133_STIJA|nr:hypothetical protein BSL78_09154 [Apostichopus japonicus]